MEHADWLEGGFDSAQARFLMMTAITQHRFSSPDWGEHEIRRLYAELTEIDVAAARVLAPRRGPGSRNRRTAERQGPRGARSFLMTAVRLGLLRRPLARLLAGARQRGRSGTPAGPG
jgi:hypothetical protein